MEKMYDQLTYGSVHPQDERNWFFSKDTNYTVKSGYIFLFNLDDLSKEQLQIWSIAMPPKA